MFYAGYGAILTPAFGVVEAYGGNTTELNNALGFFMIREYLRTLSKIEAESKSSMDSLRARLPRRLTAYELSLHSYFLHGGDGFPPRRVELLRARGRQRSCVTCAEEGWGRILLRFWVDWLVSLLSPGVFCWLWKR